VRKRAGEATTVLRNEAKASADATVRSEFSAFADIIEKEIANGDLGNGKTIDWTRLGKVCG
jgi:hypothetical protein